MSRFSKAENHRDIVTRVAGKEENELEKHRYKISVKLHTRGRRLLRPLKDGKSGNPGIQSNPAARATSPAAPPAKAVSGGAHCNPSYWGPSLSGYSGSV